MASWIAIRWMALLLSTLLLTGPGHAHDAQSGIEAADPAPMSGLDQAADFLRMPMVSVALLALAFAGLIFEIKKPGATFSGAIAAIGFVLYFWAYSFVSEFTLLSIMVFLIGLVFVGIEFFIVHGRTVSRAAGAVLVFLGLLLVTLERWPSNSADWFDVGFTFGRLAIGIVLALALTYALTYALRPAPQRPAVEAETPSSGVLSNSGLVELLGAIGVAVTPLRPTGKAQFGEQFMDVIADAEFVPPGSRVQVVELEGLRIVVKEV